MSNIKNRGYFNSIQWILVICFIWVSLLLPESKGQSYPERNRMQREQEVSGTKRLSSKKEVKSKKSNQQMQNQKQKETLKEERDKKEPNLPLLEGEERFTGSGGAPSYKASPTSHANWDLPVKLDPKVRFGKIYEFVNDPEKTKTGMDEALNYEFKYFNHGAVTKEQLRQRKGHYFIVHWQNQGEAADFKLRLDYRQTESKASVRTIELPFKNARGSKKGTFFVTGDAYEMFGSVYSWRLSVLRKGVIVAEQKSFIW